jgi:hypothetical protein
MVIVSITSHKIESRTESMYEVVISGVATGFGEDGSERPVAGVQL